MIEEVDRVRKLLADLVESKALQEAPFYNYSEAVANAKEFLAVQKGNLCWTRGKSDSLDA